MIFMNLLLTLVKIISDLSVITNESNILVKNNGHNEEKDVVLHFSKIEGILNGPT